MEWFKKFNKMEFPIFPLAPSKDGNQNDLFTLHTPKQTISKNHKFPLLTHHKLDHKQMGDDPVCRMYF